MAHAFRAALAGSFLLLSTCTHPGGGSDAGPGGCRYQSECGEQVCAAGACHEPLTCIDENDWPICHDWLEDLQPGLGDRGACIDGLCRVMCNVDTECPAGQICADFGSCRPYSPSPAPRAGGEPRRALKAGIGRELLDFPTGFPLGGYSSRVDGSNSRFGGGLSESVGQMDALEARALLLDNGEHPLMLIRVPLIFLDMSLHEGVARMLEERTGRDWRDQLIISATHTHSAPGRLWPIAVPSVLPLGLFGIGEYSQEIHRRLTASIGRAALEALDNTFDARLGWRIVEGFDVDDVVARDRRGATPPFDDNRILLIRVDDAEGNPRTVLFSFGMHGTDNESDYVTGDVLAGAEHGLEEALGRRYGRHVLTMFVNQNSGTMSPVGSGDHGVPLNFLRVGHALAQKTLPEIASMTTSAELSINSRTTRFPITYGLVGYESGDWSSEQDLPYGGDFHYGAVNCFGGWEGLPDFSDVVPEDEFNCFGLHTLLFNRPPTLLMRSQMTALQLGDLTVVTAPGELSMELSWQILYRLQQDHGVDPLKAFTWGYAQDHQLYLLPTRVQTPMPPFPGVSLEKAPAEYPEHAFSFLRGGYESSLVHWGVLSGDFFVSRASAAMARLLDPAASVPNVAAAPLTYSEIEEEPFPVDLTDATRAGVILVDMPETVQRLTPVEFAWVGGDPYAEAPQTPLVSLQHEDGTPVLLPSGEPYDNRALRFLTRMRERDGAWQWVVRWEELKDFPAGRYRLHVVGHYQQAQGELGRKEYTVDSRIFTLAPLDALTVDVALQAGGVHGTVAYPAGQQLAFTRRTDDPGAVSGSFRMRHPTVPVGRPGPVIPDEDLFAEGITVRFIQGETVMGESTATALSVQVVENVPLTHWDAPIPDGLAAGSYVLDAVITDEHGNTGTWSGTVEVP